MKKVHLLPLILIFILSCGGTKNTGPSQEEYDKLKAELEKCKGNVSELSNTPQMRLSTAQKYQQQNNFSKAKAEYQALIDKYPGSDEAKIAKTQIAVIEEAEKKKQEEEERKKTLGFKVLKENMSPKIGDVSMKFNSVSTTKTWTFDNYGYEYMYRSAERGDIFINAKVSITSESKDPKLPPISVYAYSDGKLNLIGTMDYKFTRWKDYGSYLGNYADYGNDFAHTKTITFTCGIKMSEDDSKTRPIFVVVKKTNCFTRNTDRYDKPPVTYNEGSCGVKSTLTVNDFDSEYILIKIFNKNKL